MLKDIIIAILAGIAIVPSGDPERVILVMGIAVMVFMALLWADDLWDKRQEISRRIQDIAVAISWMRTASCGTLIAGSAGTGSGCAAGLLRRPSASGGVR